MSSSSYPGWIPPPDDSPGRRASSGAARPLLATADPDLLEALLRLAGGAGVEAEVASTPRAVRAGWAGAPLVVLGDDLAASLTGRELPRRDGVVLVASDVAADQPQLWRHAVDLGATEVVVLPEGEQLLVAAFARIEHEDVGGTVVAVVGGRGGAGASVLAATLALAGVRSGGRALLVDADPWGGGADLLLGGESLPGLRWPDLASLAGTVSGRVLADALPRPHGVSVVSWDRADPLELPASAVRAVLDAGARSHDWVVVDLPRRSDDAVATVLLRATATLLVVPAEVRAAAAAAQTLAWLAPGPGTQVVVRTGRGRSLEPGLVADTLGLPLAAVVADDPRLAADLEAGEPPGTRRCRLTRTADSLLASLRAMRAAA